MVNSEEVTGATEYQTL